LRIFEQLKFWIQEFLYLSTKSGFYLVKTIVNGSLELTKGFEIAIVKALLFGEFPQAFNQV